MRKLSYIMLAAGSLYLAACNGATKQKSGNAADSGSVGNSGPVAATPNGSAAGNSNATTDTSTTGKATADPLVDSGKTLPKKH